MLGNNSFYIGEKTLIIFCRASKHSLSEGFEAHRSELLDRVSHVKR